MLVLTRGVFIFQGSCGSGYNSCEPGVGAGTGTGILITSHHHRHHHHHHAGARRENKTDTELALQRGGPGGFHGSSSGGGGRADSLHPWHLEASSRNHRKVFRRRQQSITICDGPTGKQEIQGLRVDLSNFCLWALLRLNSNRTEKCFNLDF